MSRTLIIPMLGLLAALLSGCANNARFPENPPLLAAQKHSTPLINADHQLLNSHPEFKRLLRETPTKPAKNN